jgi:hypothetical protein
VQLAPPCFTPNPTAGAARRTIEARVVQGGLPRETLTRALRRARLRVTAYPLDGFGRPGRGTTGTLRRR